MTAISCLLPLTVVRNGSSVMMCLHTKIYTLLFESVQCYIPSLDD